MKPLAVVFFCPLAIIFIIKIIIRSHPIRSCFFCPNIQLRRQQPDLSKKHQQKNNNCQQPSEWLNSGIPLTRIGCGMSAKKQNKTKTARNATVPSLPGDAHWHTNSTERRWHVKYFYIHLSVTRRTGHRVDMASRTSPTSPSSAQIFGNRRGISFLFYFFLFLSNKVQPEERPFIV